MPPNVGKKLPGVTCSTSAESWWSLWLSTCLWRKHTSHKQKLTHRKQEYLHHRSNTHSPKSN